MAKKKAQKTIKEKDVEIDDSEIISEEDQAPEDVTYSMGDIVVEGDADTDDEDALILKSGVSSVKSDDDDDTEEDVWLGDDFSLEDSDPFMDGASGNDDGYDY